ncbi:hypothetical protein VTP01DRAFT_2445 [Rhizomucor pusillus]|uniref:uncharacterized protein n=1 Tax=Rhizomucor pusillus TaxID=4840 RepID=UPI0037442D88
MFARFRSVAGLVAPWRRFLTTEPPPPPAVVQEPIKKERQKIVLNESDLVEKFVKGSGPGGQAVNKRVNCVDLKHIPTGIRVQCQQTRSLEANRGIARKLLIEKLDDMINGKLSKNAQKAAKVAKAKARRARRARKKYGTKEDKEDANVINEADKIQE